MKVGWMLAFVLLVAAEAQAQRTLYALKVDASAFPTLKADVLLIDGTSTIPFSSTEARVIEEGIDRGVLSVSCPPPAPPVDISSVLTIDVSGSMANGGPNITLARAAAKAWIDALPSGSECAITSFDNKHYLNIDFTSNKERLESVLPTLQPRGGTDYGQGFLGEPFGGLRVASVGTHRRIMIFLTDGFGGGSASSFIEMARQHDITVYCVSLGMRMPDGLRRVADSTGGLWFDNVTSVQQAVMAYRRIFAAATASGTCALSWRSDVACGPERTARIIIGRDTTSVTYAVPADRIAQLKIEPSVTAFGVVPPGVTSRREVTLTAVNADISIGRATTFGTSGFTLEGLSGPMTIPAGSSRTLTITYRGTDSSYAAGRFVLETSPCKGPTIFANAGSQYAPPARPTIRVVAPNGGERFYVGTTTTLTYEGVAPDEPVRLDISTDNGSTWRTAVQRATGLKAEWRVSNTPSERCLLRATQEQPSVRDMRKQVLTRLDGEKIKSTVFTKRGDRIITAGWEAKASGRQYYGQVRVWNAATGNLERQFDGGYEAFALPDERTVISWGEGQVFAWDITTGQLKWKQPHIPTNGPLDLQSSEDGSRILIPGGWGDETLLINSVDGKVIRQFPRADKDIRSASISPDGRMVAVCDADSSVKVFDADSSTPRFVIKETGARIYYRCAFSPAGDVLAVSSGNGTTSVFDVTNGIKLRDVATRQFYNDNTYISFSPDGSRLILESGRDRTQIFDVNSGEAIVTMKRTDKSSPVIGAIFSPDGSLVALQSFYRSTIYDAQTGVQIAEYQRSEGLPGFSPDASRIVVATKETQADVFRLQPDVLQQDVSDAVWAIERERPRLRDLRFAPRYVNTGKDSVVKFGIVNRGNAPVTVTSIAIEGAQAPDFGVLTPPGFQVPARDSVDIEYAFHPRSAGELAALVVAETDIGMRITARITGRALPSLLSANANSVDMGDVLIGTSAVQHIGGFVVNTSKIPITVERIRIAGSNDTSFSVSDVKNVTIAPGDSLPIQIRFRPIRSGRTAAVAEIDVRGLGESLSATIIGNGLTLDAYGVDPTTFRGIAIPTAIVPPAGTITTAVYDVIGMSVGASITDNVMVLTGGALPIDNTWIGAEGFDAATSYAFSAGVKAGVAVTDDVIVGGGYQWGQSTYNQDFSPGIIDSRITFNALWATAGYGSDDHRVNAWIGYAFKRHVTGFEGTFNADATIIGLNYDHRIARSWKLCVEGFFMRTMPVVPITATARYFGETYAVEAGITFVGIPAAGAPASSFPIVPMLSWVKRW